MVYVLSDSAFPADKEEQRIFVELTVIRSEEGCGRVLSGKRGASSRTRRLGIAWQRPGRIKEI